MNCMFYFSVATLGYEGFAILPRSECIDYVNVVGKKRCRHDTAERMH